jgi:uncharacterized membrane protein SpoIIM required for sporulation
VKPAPALRSERFRREREDDWRRLERLLARAEKAPDNLTDDELIAMPVLYRAALSSLSAARATSLDAGLIAYLEGLCSRAYFFVYGTRAKLLERVGRFFIVDWPASVKALWRETLVSLAVLLLGALAAYLLVGGDADWFYGFIPDDGGGRNPSASTEELRATLGGADSTNGMSAFAAFLFSHNSQVSLLAFALGFAFGVPTVLLIAYNGAALGAFVALFASRGLGLEVGGWLAIHGTTELFAAVLAGAAGFHIGKAVAFPGRLGRLESAAAAGRRAAAVMGGVIVMLFLAGLLEGFGRQLIEATALRYAVGGTMLSLWLAYFYLPRPRRG